MSDLSVLCIGITIGRTTGTTLLASGCPAPKMQEKKEERTTTAYNTFPLILNMAMKW